MTRTKLIISLVSLVLLVILGLGLNQFAAPTQYLYGIIREEMVPVSAEEIELTIPIIDEEGNRGTQTFTLTNDIEMGRFVKLQVKNNKVKGYEFINKEDLPETVKNNLVN